MSSKYRPKSTSLESPYRFEPTRLDQVPEIISDLVAEVAAAAAVLGQSLHPQTAFNLASLVRFMNCYYSNLIEGHHTRPRDIERALAGELDRDVERRNLQLEAMAHIRIQTEIDNLQLKGNLGNPVDVQLIQWMHREFYREAPAQFLNIECLGRNFTMEPGQWRSREEHDVAVGWHVPPSSDRVQEFMDSFSITYSRELSLGKTAQIIAFASSHHRFNYIHPFPDGNGRVSRLMSHAIAHDIGIAAHGLWSISRGLARGLNSRGDYKAMMNHADLPRQGDLDGRGNLSKRALEEFVEWFLRVSLDQIQFMTSLFDVGNLQARLRLYIERNPHFPPESARLLEEALIRGQFERGEISRITGLPERSARRALAAVLEAGLLGSSSPKGAVSLRFPVERAELLFPRLFPET